MVLCEILVEPYFHVSPSVDSDHPAGDLEVSHHLEAHTVASDCLAEHVKGGGKGQLRQIFQPGNYPFDHYLQHLRVSAEGNIVALAVLHRKHRNKRLFLLPPILVNLELPLQVPLRLHDNRHDLRLRIVRAIPHNPDPVFVPHIFPLPLYKPKHLCIFGFGKSHVTITANVKTSCSGQRSIKIINIINKQYRRRRMIDERTAQPEGEQEERREDGPCGEAASPAKLDFGEKKGDLEGNAGSGANCGVADEVLERELRRSGEGKLKYKKLKQRLAWLSEQMQDQGLVKEQKDITSPNKSRLMKLALQLEKSLKTQAIEYPTLESLLRQIQKIVEHRREHDLLILRAARLMTTLLLIVRRFPSLHKSEAQQSQSSLEASLRLLRIMLSLGSSREALLVGNQLPSLLSLLSCSLMRDDRRTAVSCLQLLNVVLHGPNRVELHPLLIANVEFILCSSLLKRLKTNIAACLNQDDPGQAEFLLLAFKFYYLILSLSCQGQVPRPIYDVQKPSDNLSEAIRAYFQSGVQWLAQSIMDLMFEKQSEEEKYLPREQDIPNFKINVLLYLLKSLNLIFFADVFNSQKTLECTPIFLQTLLFLLETTKTNFQESVQMKNLCSELIVLLGHLAFENFDNQERIRHSGLLESLCNHPLQYIMEPVMRNILVPTFCCLIFNNPQNFKQTFRENSVQPILQYIQREINNRTERQDLFTDLALNSKKNLSHTLSRKTSVSSLNSTYSKASVSESFSTQASTTLALGSEVRLEHRFRPEYWQQLAFDLRQIDD